MKCNLATTLGFVLLACSASPGRAGLLDLTSFSQDGGGDICAVAPYILGGTVGQAEAGSSAGGSYRLAGGFWGNAYAGPLPTATITQVVGQVQISWPAWATGFVLLQASELNPTSLWSVVPTAPQLLVDHFQVTLPLGQAAGFFQLWLE